MKLLEILIESANLGRIRNTTLVIGPQSYLEGEAEEIKRQLAKHTLVTLGPNNTSQLGGPAWVGPINDEWNEALSNALIAWKNSINIQLKTIGEKPLETDGTASLNARELKYLTGTRLNNRGLLDITPKGDVKSSGASEAPPFRGQVYKKELGSTDASTVVDTRSMVNAIGWSGWFRIAWQIAEAKEISKEPAQRDNYIIRILNNVYRYLRGNPFMWIDNWNRIVLGNAQIEAGGDNLYIDQDDRASGAVGLYNKFATIVTNLWQQDTEEEQSRETDSQSRDNNELTIGGREASLATKLYEAMKGGTGIGTDEEAIREALALLKSAADWEAVSTAYTEVSNGNILHKDLYDELKADKNEYIGIVTANLFRIGRINPLILHSSINFNGENTFEVTYDNKKYTVNKELANNEVSIDGYDGFDSIVIDSILREAITQSGNEIPQLVGVEVSAEAKQLAQSVFVEAIETSYPEMVAWYTYQEPFNQAGIDIGRLRLMGIIHQTAVLMQNGMVESDAITFVQTEISKDRNWLIGTQDDPESGAANVYFDERYSQEGIDRYFRAASEDEEVQLTDDEQEIYDLLTSTFEGDRNDGANAVLENDNAETLYLRLYRNGAKKGVYLDKELGNDDTVRDAVLNARLDNTILSKFIEKFGLPVAAPQTMAELFNESTEFSLSEGFTNDELLNALINQIRNRSDYILIDERYQKLDSEHNSLLEDMGNEELLQFMGNSYYNRLARKIGETNIELVSSKISGRLQRALEGISEEVNDQTVDDLDDTLRKENLDAEKINAIIEFLKPVEEDFSLDGQNQDPAYIKLTEIINDLEEEYAKLTGEGTPANPTSDFTPMP